MGAYGSVGAHIKTGRSPMAQEHFKTLPDPKKGHGMTKNPQKNKNLLELTNMCSSSLDITSGIMFAATAGPPLSQATMPLQECITHTHLATKGG